MKIRLGFFTKLSSIKLNVFSIKSPILVCNKFIVFMLFSIGSIMENNKQTKINIDDIANDLWASCDELRGNISS